MNLIYYLMKFSHFLGCLAYDLNYGYLDIQIDGSLDADDGDYLMKF